MGRGLAVVAELELDAPVLAAEGRHGGLEVVSGIAQQRPHGIQPRTLAQVVSGVAYLGQQGQQSGTTIALQLLIFEGVLDKYPQLKVCAAHGGGYLPSYAPRSDHSCTVSPPNCNPNIKLKKKPTEYLNQMYFDSLVFTSEALRHLIAESGVGQIMIGTDYPFPWTSTEVDLVLNTPGLSDADKIAILGGTATKLLGIK